jgi:hypothetical protein
MSLPLCAGNAASSEYGCAVPERIEMPRARSANVPLDDWRAYSLAEVVGLTGFWRVPSQGCSLAPRGITRLLAHRGDVLPLCARNAASSEYVRAVPERFEMPHSRAAHVPLKDRRAYSFAEVAGLTGFAISTLYKLMNAGVLRTNKIAGRRIVTPDALEDLLRASSSATSPSDEAQR